jgi:hypothetical protein
VISKQLFLTVLMPQTVPPLRQLERDHALNIYAKGRDEAPQGRCNKLPAPQCELPSYTLPLTYRHSTDLCVVACNIPSFYSVVLIPARSLDVSWEVPTVQHLYDPFLNCFTRSTTY